MRSRATNILQIIVLFTGIIYIVIGLFFYISPLTVLEFFAENVSFNWLDLVRDHELIAPLYNISRGLSALLFVSGVAMILPLFDPLKYRGLIYYNGLLFPFLASILFVKNSIALIFVSQQPGNEGSGSFFTQLQSHGGHLIVFILAVIFVIIFLSTLAGLLVTKKQAQQGLE